MSVGRKWTVTLGLSVLLAGLGALALHWMRELTPNALAVGGTGLIGGVIVALLIVLWWPTGARHNNKGD